MTLNIHKNHSPFYRKLALYILFIFAINFLTYGQENNTDTIPIAEDSESDSTENELDYNYLNFDLTYTNNKINSRRQETKHVPGLLGGISFNHKIGLYTDISIIDYFEASIQTYDYDFTLGFQKDIKSIIDIDLYYDYHGFKGDTLYQGIVYNHSGGLSLGLTLKTLFLFANGYIYSGKTENYFLDIGISAIEQFDEIFTKNDYILLQPTISASYGTDYWLYENMGPIRKKYVLYILTNRGFKTEEFEYQGIDIMVPVSYGIGDLSLMFAWMYYIPSDKFKFIGWTDQSGYMISLSYMLNFK
jgi:hypothetical protein